MDVARPSTLGQCAGQCRGSGKVRIDQIAVYQSMKSGNIKSQIHYSKNNPIKALTQ